MIKTLRITTVLVGLLATGFLASPIVYGVENDHEIEKFLDTPGAVEKFKKSKGKKRADSQVQDSPLVKQAKAFAMYLNPPPDRKSKKPSSKSSRITGIPRPATVSAKFELIGTSFYPTHPELSLALIDQPGKGFRWIRQSAEVGHLVIEQIKDGSIVVRDGEKIFELVAKRPEKRSLLKKPATDQTGAGSASTSSTRNKAGTAEDILPPVPEDTAAFMEKLIVELEQMQLKAEEIEQELDDANGNDMDVLGKMISELKTMKISPEEARQLDDLGRQLQDSQQEYNDGNEPNQADEPEEVNEPGQSDTDQNRPERQQSKKSQPPKRTRPVRRTR
jgi:hypothetical protein